MLVHRYNDTHIHTHTHTGCYQKTSFVFANASIDFIFFFFSIFHCSVIEMCEYIYFESRVITIAKRKDRFRSRNSSSLVRGNEYHFIESDDSIFYFNSILHEICEYFASM